MHASWVAIDTELLRQLYIQERLTIDEIAVRFGCGATTISRRLRAAAILTRPRGPNPERYARRPSCITPSITWSPALAWIVGLIATDGNLSRDQRHISITSKDQDLLETVKDHLGLTNTIVRVTGGFGTTCWRLQWGHGRLYAWLTEIGVTPAKSLTLKPLTVPDEYFRDFLRGCIDGDGCILTYTDRYHVPKNASYVYERLYVGLVSGSRPFIEWMLDTMRRLLGLRGGIHVSDRGRRNPLYEVRFAKRDSLRILRWIYYTPTVPCLARKREKALPFL